MQVSCRIQKLKVSHLSGVQKHNEREFETPNADPCKTDLNQRLIGDGPLSHLVMERITDHGLTVCQSGKNASVVAVEMVLSASPEYFRDDPNAYGVYDQGKTDIWVQRNLDFLKTRYGANLVCVDLHLDEATPHLHAVVTPIVQKQKKRRRTKEQIQSGQPAKTYLASSLDAKNMFDRTALITLQDEAALAVADLGIRRGVRGSKAKHTAVKEFYSVVNLDVDAVTVKAPTLKKSDISLFNKNDFIKNYNHRLSRFFKKINLKLQDLTSKVTHLQSQNNSLRNAIPQYLDLGEPDTLREKLERLEQYQSLGDFNVVASLVKDGRSLPDLLRAIEVQEDLLESAVQANERREQIMDELGGVMTLLQYVDPQLLPSALNEKVEAYKNDYLIDSPKEERVKEDMDPDIELPDLY